MLCQYGGQFTYYDDELEDLHLNPVRKGSVQQPEDGRWSNDNRFAWEKATIAGSPLPVDAVWLP
ncbi:MAG: hypothetical protein ABSA59_15740 [Terriglobia bacterium]|jgi:hypothetical protein